VNVRFACPGCETEREIQSPNEPDWRCECGHEQHLYLPGSEDSQLANCAACGNKEVYRRKNFPQWLGMLLLAGACAAFFTLQGLYLPTPAWIILLGSAAFDLVLYLIVGDVIVCYRCQARHYGLRRQKSYTPFELATAEKYRQEKLRRQQVKG
jgi:hypothetical protein